MSEYVIPQNLHKPLQILWFDTYELGLMGALYIGAMLFGGLMWVLLVVGPFFLIPEKRQARRGALVHLFYSFGIYGLEGYPSASARLFRH